MKNIIKHTTLFALAALALVSCKPNEVNKTADEKLTEQTEQAMQEANRQVGMPAIKNYQERKLMKMILELRDQENLTCYAYIIDMNGKRHFLGKCIGYGLPYSVQYTNPERLEKGGYRDIGYWATTIPQPDPNGLFMPEGLSATWLMLIDPKTNQPRPVYVEPEIVVSPFPLH